MHCQVIGSHHIDHACITVMFLSPLGVHRITLLHYKAMKTPLNIINWNTVLCHYNTVNFHQNHHNRHPIACPLGQDMGSLLWVQALIYVLPLSLKSCMEYHVISLWRRQMETFSMLLAICAGNSPVTSQFLSQRPVTWSFDVFFDLHQNKWFSKQRWGWSFEMPSCPFWRHCNDFTAL